MWLWIDFFFINGRWLQIVFFPIVFCQSPPPTNPDCEHKYLLSVSYPSLVSASTFSCHLFYIQYVCISIYICEIIYLDSYLGSLSKTGWSVNIAGCLKNWVPQSPMVYHHVPNKTCNFGYAPLLDIPTWTYTWKETGTLGESMGKPHLLIAKLSVSRCKCEISIAHCPVYKIITSSQPVGKWIIRLYMVVIS